MPYEASALDLRCDVMLEGMEAIRNIAGALRAWDLKPDDERLATIFAISDALHVFDSRSKVAEDVAREALETLRERQPEVSLMLPKAFAWLEAHV